MFNKREFNSTQIFFVFLLSTATNLSGIEEVGEPVGPWPYCVSDK